MKGIGTLLIVCLAACSNAGDSASVVGAVSSQRGATAHLERYQRIVRNVADCRLEGHQIDPSCPGNRELAAGIAGVPLEVRAEVGRSLLGHPSPAVRIEAAALTGTTSLDALVEAAARERDPGVLRAFLRLLTNHGAANPGVGKVLLAAAAHPSKEVRLEAVHALASPVNRGLVGASTTLARLAEHDPELAVRTATCEEAGKLGTDELIPLYTRLTADTAQPELHAACMEGLVRMFHDHPQLGTANAQAYRLFLDRLEHQPRSETTPPWSVMSTFCYFSHGSDADKLAAWKRRAPWFDAVEVKRVMTSVIADKATSWMARAAAIESMVGLGAGKAELAALRRSIDPKDKPVLAKLASTLAE